MVGDRTGLAVVELVFFDQGLANRFKFVKSCKLKMFCGIGRRRYPNESKITKIGVSQFSLLIILIIISTSYKFIINKLIGESDHKFYYENFRLSIYLFDELRYNLSYRYWKKYYKFVVKKLIINIFLNINQYKKETSQLCSIITKGYFKKKKRWETLYHCLKS